MLSKIYGLWNCELSIPLSIAIAPTTNTQHKWLLNTRFVTHKVIGSHFIKMSIISFPLVMVTKIQVILLNW